MNGLKAIKNLLCGAAVGVANIIPGVSGGTMAVVLGVYPQLLEAMGLKNLRKNIPFLIPFGLGCGGGILAFSRVIRFLLERYPMATNFTFLGLILGSLPMIWRKASGAEEKLRNSSLAALLGCFLLLLWMNSMRTGEVAVLTGLDGATALWLAAAGAVSAFAMILPGVSGSFVLLLLGAYPTVLAAVSRLDIRMLLPVAAGMAVGLLLGCRLVSRLLEKWPQQTYFGILGLIFGSLGGIFPGFALNGEGLLSLLLLAGAAVLTARLAGRD